MVVVHDVTDGLEEHAGHFLVELVVLRESVYLEGGLGTGVEVDHVLVEVQVVALV